MASPERLFSMVSTSAAITHQHSSAQQTQIPLVTATAHRKMKDQNKSGPNAANDSTIVHTPEVLGSKRVTLEAIDGGQDVLEVGVAKVGHHLGVGLHHAGCESAQRICKHCAMQNTCSHMYV